MRLSVKDKTEKQQKVLALTKLGFTNKEISKITNVTEKTVGLWIKNKNLKSFKNDDDGNVEILKEMITKIIGHFCNIEINKISIELSIKNKTDPTKKAN